MSTSCIIALYSKEDDEIVLLERTHDGFLDDVKALVDVAKGKHFEDLEEITNYLLKNTDVRFSIYSHKWPQYAFIYFVDTDKWITKEISPKIEKISECLQDIKNEIKKENLCLTQC